MEGASYSGHINSLQYTETSKVLNRKFNLLFTSFSRLKLNVIPTKLLLLLNEVKYFGKEYHSSWGLQRENHERLTREKTRIKLTRNHYLPSKSAAIFSMPSSSSWSLRPLRHRTFSSSEPFLTLSKSTCNKESDESLSQNCYTRVSRTRQVLYSNSEVRGFQTLAQGLRVSVIRGVRADRIWGGRLGTFWKTHQFNSFLDNIKIIFWNAMEGPHTMWALCFN